MTKEEVFSFPSADGRTTVHAVRWTPEDGKYRAVFTDNTWYGGIY